MFWRLPILVLLVVTMMGAQVAPVMAREHTVEQQAAENWKEVRGGGRTPDAPASVVYRKSEYLFVRGTDDRIHLNRLNRNDWNGWREVPGRGKTESAPDATVYRDRLNLFVRGTDDRIYVNRLTGR